MRNGLSETYSEKTYLPRLVYFLHVGTYKTILDKLVRAVLTICDIVKYIELCYLYLRFSFSMCNLFSLQTGTLRLVTQKNLTFKRPQIFDANKFKKNRGLNKRTRYHLLS